MEQVGEGMHASPPSLNRETYANSDVRAYLPYYYRITEGDVMLFQWDHVSLPPFCITIP